jgi:hypothetical protein
LHERVASTTRFFKLFLARSSRDYFVNLNPESLGIAPRIISTARRFCRTAIPRGSLVLHFVIPNPEACHMSGTRMTDRELRMFSATIPFQRN